MFVWDLFFLFVFGLEFVVFEFFFLDCILEEFGLEEFLVFWEVFLVFVWVDDVGWEVFFVFVWVEELGWEKFSVSWWEEFGCLVDFGWLDVGCDLFCDILLVLLGIFLFFLIDFWVFDIGCMLFFWELVLDFVFLVFFVIILRLSLSLDWFLFFCMIFFCLDICCCRIFFCFFVLFLEEME